MLLNAALQEYDDELWSEFRQRYIALCIDSTIA